VSPSDPLPQYGFGQDLQWYATDAIAGHNPNFRRHPPLEQARLPGLSSRFFFLVDSKPVDDLQSTSVIQAQAEKVRKEDFAHNQREAADKTKLDTPYRYLVSIIKKKLVVASETSLAFLKYQQLSSLVDALKALLASLFFFGPLLIIRGNINVRIPYRNLSVSECG
jgi:hypothetical protein